MTAISAQLAKRKWRRSDRQLPSATAGYSPSQTRYEQEPSQETAATETPLHGLPWALYPFPLLSPARSAVFSEIRCRRRLGACPISPRTYPPARHAVISRTCDRGGFFCTPLASADRLGPVAGVDRMALAPTLQPVEPFGSDNANDVGEVLPSRSGRRCTVIRPSSSAWSHRPLCQRPASPALAASSLRLRSHLRCSYAGDIRDGQDALALDHYGRVQFDHYKSALVAPFLQGADDAGRRRRRPPSHRQARRSRGRSPGRRPERLPRHRHPAGARRPREVRQGAQGGQSEACPPSLPFADPW